MTIQSSITSSVTLEASRLWRQRGHIEEDALVRLLGDLSQALGPVHDRGEVHGRIGPAHILIDAEGRAGLYPPVHPDAGKEAHPVLNTSGQDMLFGVLSDGYAAFEQYMLEDAWPVGPWSDVHAASAVAYALVVGRHPDNAVKRMVAPKPIEFAEKDRAAFSPRLLAAIARGLSTHAPSRQQSMDEFMIGLAGASAAEAGKPITMVSALAPGQHGARPERAELEHEAIADSPAAEDIDAFGAQEDIDAAPQLLAPKEDKRNAVGWGMPLVVLLLLAAGTGVWLFKDSDGGSSGAAVAESYIADAAGSDASGSGSGAGATLASADSATGNAVGGNSDDASSFGENPVGESPTTESSMGESPADREAFASSDYAAPTAAPASASAPFDTGLPGPEVAPPGGREELEWTVVADGAPVPSSTEANTGNEPEVSVEQADSKPISSVNVQVNVQPWGEVIVDGASRGVSPPLKQLSLPPGTYQIRIENGDLPPVNQQLTVEAGEPARIQHAFESS